MKHTKKSIKTVAAILMTIMLVFAFTSVTVFADSAPVAMVGDTPYTTIADAIKNVGDGGTVQLLAGEFDEAVSTGRIDKSFTIVGADNYSTVLSGGIQIGTDNSSWPIQECTVTVKGIAFKNNGLAIMDVRNTVVEDNKFENIDKYAIRVLDQATDGKEASVVVKNNYVDGAEHGIRIRTPHTVEITGNTVKNTQHNSVTIEYGKWPANNGSITIANNTFENWALGGEGRAVRSETKASEIEKEISFTGNKMIHEGEPAEEYLKLTGVGTTTVNLEKNYWNSAAPDFDTIITVEGGSTAAAPVEFYKAEAMKAEDLNTYVAPPAAEEDDKQEEEKKVEEKKEEKPAATEDKKSEATKTDNKATSPKTGANKATALMTIFMSAAICYVAAAQIKKRAR